MNLKRDVRTSGKDNFLLFVAKNAYRKCILDYKMEIMSATN